MADGDRVGDGAQRLETLDRTECLALLTKEAFLGRLGVIVNGHPEIFPVNYIADSSAVVFCTAGGTKLDAIQSGSPVTFEVDGHQPLHHAGWSVMVRGPASVVTDADDLARLQGGPLRPWVRGARANWVRIEIAEISGRRLPGI
jgi:nitroimidazol reductase NimA-like FMN-containing flavoprotein (pyridoxamine 5'-phosphate oxidase superfamily)